MIPETLFWYLCSKTTNRLCKHLPNALVLVPVFYLLKQVEEDVFVERKDPTTCKKKIFYKLQNYKYI